MKSQFRLVADKFAYLHTESMISIETEAIVDLKC